jgi:hypothetical protein
MMTDGGKSRQILPASEKLKAGNRTDTDRFAIKLK